jgi:hypothetical protein
MAKNFGKFATVKTEAVINSDLLFNDDALVVDYLNALLVSSPGMNLHSGEISISPLTMEAEWESFGVSNSALDTAVFFDFAKMEADRLRSENENLKLQSELLKIDAQVLRSENNNLKLEVACMKTELRDVKCTLDKALTENNALNTGVKSLNDKIKTLTTSAINVTPLVHVAFSPSSEKTDAKGVEADAKQVVVDECVEFVIETKEAITVLPLAVQQNNMPCESIKEISTTPVIVERTQRVDEKICSGTEQDTAMISRVNFADERNIQRPDHDAVKLFRQQVATEISIQSAKPVSKIIKQHQTRKDQSHIETDQLLIATAPEPFRDDKISKEPDRTLTFVQQQHVMEPETRQQEDAVSDDEIRRLDGSDEIDLEPVPAPKVVVKRNVKKYEDLQNKTDSNINTKAGHNVIL